MRKTLLLLKLIAALTVACAAPVQSQQSTTQSVERAATSVPPTPRPAPTESKPDPTATPSSATSDASFESSVLLASWHNRARQHELRLFDPRQGLPLAGYAPIQLGRNFRYAFSVDEKTLAVIAYPSDMNQRNGVLHLIEVQAWRDVTTTLKFDGWAYVISFSPDGSRLAVAYFDEGAGRSPQAETIVVIDVASQTIAARIAPGYLPHVLEFTPDGRSLIVYGVGSESGNGLNSVARVALFSAADLSVLWEQPLPDILDGQYGEAAADEPGQSMWWTPAVVPSPDRQRLYIVHADEDKLTTINFADRSTTSVVIGPARSWLDRLMTMGAGVAHAKVLDGTRKHATLSLDGTRLYVVGETAKTAKDAQGEWQFTQTSLPLQVVDVASGVEIAKIETQASEISLSPDGSQLYLRGWDTRPWTDVLDTARLEVVAHLTGRWVIPAQQMDGQPILLANDTHTGNTTLAALETSSLREIRVWSLPGYAVWVSPSWDPDQW